CRGPRHRCGPRPRAAGEPHPHPDALPVPDVPAAAGGGRPAAGAGGPGRPGARRRGDPQRAAALPRPRADLAGGDRGAAGPGRPPPRRAGQPALTSKDRGCRQVTPVASLTEVSTQVSTIRTPPAGGVLRPGPGGTRGLPPPWTPATRAGTRRDAGRA